MGLEDLAFATELVISEPVTNTIRYGVEPRRLRVLREGTSLICAVADGSSTSPHLRRAADTDEGGRGLFLVAQFTQRWGHPLPAPRQGDLDGAVAPQHVGRTRRGHGRSAAGPMERRGLVIAVTLGHVHDRRPRRGAQNAV
ncbi:hypothetical protein IQ64_46985 [Streptomyces stelliscabiei]|uniref:Histidine kinase/HSP90-like ATPase domain-containing protein n=1 Tax=Streptomyces stelliscabiei TaxID=146820 RepID=A0A8I0TQK3_9ACTN|nr:hypothetical protein IQ64_46985 [Streptomyces stelliscabiei]MBE1594293.1 hypothetical protein [Streptomyces stelliscabiei]